MFRRQKWRFTADEGIWQFKRQPQLSNPVIISDSSASPATIPSAAAQDVSPTAHAMACDASTMSPADCRDGGDRQICVMVHGMGGTCEDWQTWLEVLKHKHPSWVLQPLKSLSSGCRFLGRDLRELSSIASAEIIEAIRAHQAPDSKTTLHCIGHSMGGLIIRGALPRVLEEFDQINLGHYVSLSSPHLGIQSSWLSPLHSWRNLCWLSQPISNQLVHLAIQDTRSLGTPFLVELSQPESDHMTALGRFEHRTCVSLAFGDPLIPPASGLIDPYLLMEGHGPFHESFWQLTLDDSWPASKACKTLGQQGKAGQ